MSKVKKKRGEAISLKCCTGKKIAAVLSDEGISEQLFGGKTEGEVFDLMMEEFVKLKGDWCLFALSLFDYIVDP